MSGPLPNVLLPLTLPASWAYGRIVQARNARFDRGVGVQHAGRPVISVGNITTGGTGKTPMVAWIVEQLRAAGHCPVIAMRGYKAAPGEPSDEQAEYAERLPGVPVLANPNRIAALREFLPQHPRVDCVVLDDGFQHRTVHRDLDLALIDALADTFADRLLPAGNLREPIATLQRADAVIVTHAESEISSLKSHIAKSHGRPPVAWSRHVWNRLHVHDSTGSRECAAEWLRGKRVVTMLGIGKPKSVSDQIASLGGMVAVNIPCRDHEQFDRAKIALARSLGQGADALLVTAKDWVKLRRLIDWASWPLPIVVPRLELEVFQGADRLRDLVLSTIGVATADNPAR